MSKLLPAISKPGSIKFPTKGPHNPNVGTHGSGIAPRPKGGAPIPGNDRPTAPSQNGLARVAGTGGNSPSGVGGPAGSFLPVQKPVAGVASQRIGQSNPNPAAAATKKPNRKGGAPFYGEC